MSRLGKIPLPIPAKVKVAVTDGSVHVEGPKGKLAQPVVPFVAITVSD